MADCPNCGKKVGFMGARKCGVCGKELCKECARYLTKDEGKGSLREKVQGPSKGALCSDDCARSSYEAFEKEVGAGAIVHLTNYNNDRVVLREAKGEKDHRSRIFTVPNSPDGRKRPGGDLIPELVDIYELMKADLETKDHILNTGYVKVTRGG